MDPGSKREDAEVISPAKDLDFRDYHLNVNKTFII